MASNTEIDNLDEEFLTDSEVAKRCRQEATVGRLVLSYLKKHAGWHYATDVCHATKAFEKYGTEMCYREIRGLIDLDELEEEERDSKLYIRLVEEEQA